MSTPRRRCPPTTSPWARSRSAVTEGRRPTPTPRRRDTPSIGVDRRLMASPLHIGPGQRHAAQPAGRSRGELARRLTAARSAGQSPKWAHEGVIDDRREARVAAADAASPLLFPPPWTADQPLCDPARCVDAGRGQNALFQLAGGALRSLRPTPRALA